MKKFKLFDMNRPGKGVEKEKALRENNTGFSGFFRMYKNRFWNLSSLNLIYIIANFPIFFGIFALSGNLDIETTAASSEFYPIIYGISQYGSTPFTSTLSSVIGGSEIMRIPSTATIIVGLLTLLVIFTNGISNVGVTYVLRGFVRGEPVYILADFIEGVKKNWLKGFVLGIIDSIILFILAYGTLTYFMNGSQYIVSVMLVAEILLFVLYLTMRFYMYMLLITFKLNIFKVLKNSFIFSLIGFKRNFFAWIGIIVVVCLNLFLVINFLPVGVILPFIITSSTLMFVSAFCAYPVIKQYMIDPYYTDDKADKITPVEEPIFVDRG